MRTFSLQCLTAITLAFESGIRSDNVTVGDIEFDSLGRIGLDRPSFLDYDTTFGEKILIATDFSPFFWVSAGVSICKLRKESVAAGDVTDLKFTHLDTSPYKFKWAQDARAVPLDVFPGVKAIAVPDGFVPPFKKDGALYIV